MRLPFPSTGLYAITQTERKNDDTIIQEVSSALKGGASVIQYRNKESGNTLHLANKLLSLCKENNIPFIINDDVKLANQIGADGVHLGKDDSNILEARKILGTHAIIGLSCYNDLTLAIKAEQLGANYVAFGRFFPSNSKPLASPARIETLHQARKQIKLPIVAIGGILPKNGKQLLKAGADILAVIGGIFDHEPEKSVKAYLKLFN